MSDRKRLNDGQEARQASNNVARALVVNGQSSAQTSANLKRACETASAAQASQQSGKSK